MKCANPACTCGTVDGGYCSKDCTDHANQLEAANLPCGCGHVGCMAS